MPWNLSLPICLWAGVRCNDENISSLILTRRGLRGSLPDSLARLGGQLRIINITWNDALRGTMPREYANFTQLSVFDVSNNFLSGTIPSGWGSWRRLGHFSVANNNLTGSIPAALGRCEQITGAFFNSNAFDGTLSSEFGAWSIANKIDFGANRLSGTLPESFSNWSEVETLKLGENLLTGTLPPEFDALVSLRYFEMSSNFISGTLPRGFGKWTLLVSFRAWSNELRGTLPDSYRAWSNVRVIILADNRLEGSIPESWGTSLAHLETLILSGNTIGGTLPPALTSQEGSPLLQVLFLDRNRFHGTLPPQWRNLFVLSVQDNPQLSGFISTSPSFFLLICNTSLCVSPTSSQPLFCTPPGIASQVESNPSMLLQFPVPVASAACTSETRTLENPQVEIERDPSSQNALLPTSAIMSLAAYGGLAVGLVSVSSASTADDIQMLAAVLSSPCVCRWTADAITHDGDGEEGGPPVPHAAELSIALSPFAPLSSALWMAVGNMGLVIVVAAVTVATLGVVCGKRVNRSPEVRSQWRFQRITSWVEALVFSVATRPMRQRWRYPSTLVSFSVFLCAGMVKGSVATISDGASQAWEIVVASVAISFAVLVVYVGVLEVLMYRRHVNIGVTERTVRSSARGATSLHYLKYASPPRLYYSRRFRCIPGVVLDKALPRGQWGPADVRATVGGLVSSFTLSDRHYWRLSLAANVVIQSLSAISIAADAPSFHASCDGLQIASLMICLATAAAVAIAKPHRAWLLSMCMAVQLSLVGLITLLQILCRHQALGVVPTDVSSAAVAVSVAMVVMKIYQVLLPRLENWLAPVDVQGEWEKPGPLLSEISQPGRTRKAQGRQRVATPPAGGVEPNSVIPSPIEINQRDALRQLIELVANSHHTRRSDGGHAISTWHD